MHVLWPRCVKMGGGASTQDQALEQDRLRRHIQAAIGVRVRRIIAKRASSLDLVSLERPPAEPSHADASFSQERASSRAREDPGEHTRCPARARRRSLKRAAHPLRAVGRRLLFEGVQ